MRAAFASVAFAALAAANPMPQGVTSAISPQQSPPPGCSPNYDGSFGLSPVNVTSSTKAKRQASTHNNLGITLQNGILMDAQGRTGYIAANQQFQFDDPPQTGAIYTAGFSVCQNGTMALGNDVTWFRCLSGASTTSTTPFYNIYFENELGAGQCIESHIQAVPLNSGDGPASVPGSLATEVFSTTSVANTTSTSSTSMPSLTGAMNATTTTTSSGAGGAASTMTGTNTAGGSGGSATGGSGGSSATGAGSSASASASSASTGGAPTAHANEMFGLAAGLLAFAVL